VLLQRGQGLNGEVSRLSMLSGLRTSLEQGDCVVMHYAVAGLSNNAAAKNAWTIRLSPSIGCFGSGLQSLFQVGDGQVHCMLGFAHDFAHAEEFMGDPWECLDVHLDARSL
jgi:hypothetical protein